jgi:hypothetical protein
MPLLALSISRLLLLSEQHTDTHVSGRWQDLTTFAISGRSIVARLFGKILYFICVLLWFSFL